jgi:hypothetical protein
MPWQGAYIQDSPRREASSNRQLLSDVPKEFFNEDDNAQ